MDHKPEDCKKGHLLDYCKTCGRKFLHKYVHDSPHGIPEAVLDNSYRKTCTVCGTLTKLSKDDWEIARKRHRMEVTPHL